MATQRSKALTLRRLHRGPSILVLPNAWDAASARIFEDAGFPAIATTSGGVAFSLGYPDGENAPRDEMIDAIHRIARSVAVPVTADIEAGYGRRAKDVASTVKAVIAAGAVGINLEDGTRDQRKPLREIAEQAERIRAAREAGAAAGVPIVINARVDVYLRRVGEEAERLSHTVRRAEAYLEAGADCIFPILAPDGATIAALAREIHGPINVIAGPGIPSIPELQRLGVARVSFGSGPMRASMAAVRRIAKELLANGTYTALLGGAIAGSEMNRLMAKRK
jgi:2-methylisocitrate lyase-like PEP mutase family enzyme